MINYRLVIEGKMFHFNSWTQILPSGNSSFSRAAEAMKSILNEVFEPGYISVGRTAAPAEEALLYSYWSKSYNDAIWAERAVERLNVGIDRAAWMSRRLGLHGGLSGVGWHVEHLSRLLGAGDEVSNLGSAADQEDLNAEVDKLIIQSLDVPFWNGDYDLVSGLVGYGVYFLERMPRATAIDGLRLVIQHLGALGEYDAEGIAWYSKPHFLPQWQRELNSNGYYNLGVAHGIPAVLHFLNETSAVGVETKTCEALLDAGVKWLIARRRFQGSKSWFSSWFAPGSQGNESRLAWCYGDLGIMAVLQQIAFRTRREEWKQFADGLLDHCISWPMEESGVKDASLCHGAAGNAHIFNRIYQYSGNERCRESALAWFERALNSRKSGAGIGGFLFCRKPNPHSPPIWDTMPGFLDGSIGVALTLLAATSCVEPQWDRMLQLSGRATQLKGIP